ncbi:MAG TPA: response regulator transcription factor [Acidimicrobiia bacterium]|nr:response regulator transcription factor [Acidimicrobiia bacterium]
MTSRVLVVDDEPQILRTVGLDLRAHDYVVDLAETGEAALDLAARNHPDIVVVDLGLPGIGGLDVIERLRRSTRIPIVVLSVRDTEADKVAAIDAGADDYVTKPFGMDELLARIRAALGHGAVGDRDQPVIETASFTVDLVEKRVTRGGEEVPLTPTEWQLMEVLVRNRGRLVPQHQLMEAVPGIEHDDEVGSLREHVGRLRRKLEPEPSRPRYLATEPGLGYRFETVD